MVELPAHLLKAANDSGLEMHKFVPRPAFGTVGKPAKVAVNSYAVTKFPNATVYQYDVSIGKGDEKRGLLRKIWYCETLQKAFGNAANTVLFDGNKLAWSVVPLPFGESFQTIIDLDEGRDMPSRPGASTRDNKHRVLIKRSGRVPLQVTEAYVNGRQQLDNDVLVGINFLDHLMRETPSKHFITIKRSFFQSRGAQPLDGGVEAWKGIFQSVRVVSGGRLTINVDVATAVFWQQNSVLAVTQALMRCGSAEDLANKLRTPSGMRDLKRIKKIGFKVKHGGERNRTKQFSVEGFGKSARETFFDMKRKEQGGKEERISIDEYFYKYYNIRLRYPMLPLLLTKKKSVLFPMELAFVSEGQRYPFKLDDRQTADMIRFTVQRPNVRSEAIKHNVGLLNWRQDPLLKAYGMEINPEMIQTRARILPAPKIVYGAGSQGDKFVPDSGRWDLRGKKFIKASTLNSWGVMICADQRRVPQAMVANFVKQMCLSYANHGGLVTNKDPPILYMNPQKDIGGSVKEIYNAAGNKVNARPQILFFVLQMKSQQPYNAIKAFCDTNLGVVSQCVQMKHVEQAKAQYCSNVCMKVNAKLGGNTLNLDKDHHPLFGREPTIYIGADVSHGGAFGGGGMKAASFASMCGSVDLQGARYAACVNTNGFRVEVITTKNIIKFIPTLLRAYKKNTGQIPRRMFYFRDGVSEGQYLHIIEQELHDIKEACKKLDPNYTPFITVVVCTKRHHSRFFPLDKHASDRNGNVVPGTIVERDITHPTEYDFYLTSHAAIQGTARATRYTVIHDENKMPVDKFQALVYNFCYTYMRATNSVSLIPPVYYAHLASARARAHEVMHEGEETKTTTSAGESGKSSLPPTEFEDLVPLGAALEDQMWYI